MSFIKTVQKYTPPPNRDIGDWGTVEETKARELQHHLDDLVNRLGLVGVQVSLKTPGGGIWHGAGGTADWRRRIPLTTNHIMRIASTTKLFTSVTTLSLVDNGLLRMDEPINRWLPHFPRGDQITIAMLLSHTSGIGHPPFTLKVKLRLLFSRNLFTLDELVALAADTPFYDTPGGSHRYSNANHHLLGAIAQAATGRTIADLVDETILARLHLSQTVLLPFRSPPKNLISGWDNIYTPSLYPFEVKPTNTILASHASTSGGMVSTARELLVFIDGLFAEKLVSASLLTQMSDVKACHEPAFHHTGYGIGLFRIGIDGIDYLGHLGLFVGSQALVIFSPTSGGAMAVVGNLSESRVFDIAAQFAAEIR